MGLPKNVFLIGFMGTGKSLVGRLLSDELSFGFLDTDQEIEKRAGQSIPDIFANMGEEAFRDMETEALRELERSDIARFVVACGGGIVGRPENIALLKKLGRVVLLTASVDAILERTGRDRHRPLLHTPDPRARVMELLARREPLYEAAADIVLDTSEGQPAETVARILRELGAGQIESAGGQPS